jgi:tetratricopeptide (TPR) repeat protein
VLGGRITSNDKDRGAAFAITARLAVTAHHVVREREAASLRFIEDSGRTIEIDRVEGDEELDIALLHLRADASDVLPLGEAADEFNWRVEMQPRGNDPWLTGRITAARRKFINQRKYETQVVQLQVNELLGEYVGYSGSPVLLDAYPNFVVGVLVEELRLRVQRQIGQTVPASNVLYAIPASSIIARFRLTLPLRSAPARSSPRGSSEAVVLAAAEPRLAQLPVETIPAPSELPEGSRMPLASNPLFVGRERDLRALAAALRADVSAAAGRTPVTIAAGPPGIGKTQLCVEFAHRYGAFFAGGVFWLNFSNPALIPTEVAECGLDGAFDLRPDFATLPLDARVALVTAAWRRPMPRLLVFDNCEDPLLLESWRPASGGCRVLITSRRMRWDSTTNATLCPVEYLPRTNSVDLLTALLARSKMTVSPMNAATLDAIAQEVGDLPLALHVAGSVLALYHTQIAPRDYLEQLRGPRQFEALELDEDEAGGPSPTHHLQSVQRMFAFSVGRLDPANDGDRRARQLLARAAHFAPGEPIQRPLLLGTIARAGEDAISSRIGERAVRRLVDLGLLEEAESNAVRMHRLVAAFVGRELTREEDEAAVEEAMLRAAREQGRATMSVHGRALQSHLRFVADAAVQGGEARTAELCSVLGVHLRALGDYLQAAVYFDRALQVRRTRLPPDHPEIIWSLHDLGHVLKDLGKLADAQDRLQRALDLRRATLGSSHPDTVGNLIDLAFVLKDEGKFKEARQYFKEALRIRKQELGESHPDTVTCLDNIGLVYKDQGKLLEARRQFERALEITTDARGDDHPDTVPSLHNLAWVLVDQGLRVQALPYLERALAIQQRTFGEQDPRTVVSLNSLGELLMRQGAFGDAKRDVFVPPPARYPEQRAQPQPRAEPRPYEQARKYFEKALTIQQRTLGDRHPETVRILVNLGTAMYQQKKEQGDVWPDWQAEQYLKQARELFEVTLGADHAETLEVATLLGRLEAEKNLLRESYQGG